MFLSYAHTDRDAVLALRDALDERGLRVWFDASNIETTASITRSVTEGVARSKALVAYYSTAYPMRRACQWELTAAYLAAESHGRPTERVLIVNPEASLEHVQPVQLRDAAAPRDVDGIVARVATLKTCLGEVTPASRPSWHGLSPIGSPRFVGRMADMWEIHSALHSADFAVITGSAGDGVAHLTGMGGIGKSLLAIEYGMRFAAAYPGGVFWLRAFGHGDGPGSLGAGDRSAQRDIQISRFAADFGVDTGGLTPPEILRELGRALDAQRQPFLWVVDDLPGGITRTEFDDWLVPCRWSKTLVTTRSREYSGVASQLSLGVFSEAEGLELLLRHRLPDGPAELEAARRLVFDMGGHALALDVTGGALRAERGVRSFVEYRAALQEHTQDELQLAAELAHELPTGHERNIATTLARSIRQLSTAGLDFLRLASVLATEPIPTQFVVATFELAEGLPDRRSRADEREPEFSREQAVRGMHDAWTLSLSEVSDNRDSARQVHVLVAHAIRVLEPDHEALEFLSRAATATLIRQIGRAPEVQAPAVLLAHARHVARASENFVQATLLHLVAVEDMHRGDYRTAANLQSRAIQTLIGDLGDRNEITLQVMGNMAVSLKGLGDYQAARSLQERVLEVRRETLGEDHHDTLITKANLAEALRALGDFAAARTLLEEVVRGFRETRGSADASTLAAVNNLALALQGLDEVPASLQLLRGHLAAVEQAFGTAHPTTLITKHNYALALELSGDYAQARELNESILASSRKVLGEDHPRTLQSMSNLGSTRYRCGDHEGARAILEEALDRRQRVQGTEHPETLMSMNALGFARLGWGDSRGAVDIYEQTVALARCVFGDDHLNTLTATTNLAAALHAVGDVETARQMLERAVVLWERSVGSQHPSAMAARENLAEMERR